MDKTFCLKKKEIYTSMDNEEDTICIKFDIQANHLLSRDIVESIEKQI